ncbi:MAG: ABC transporter substrate-binding protein [Actinobacteria bacterium]|nr:ABC transporter substrate-binding protein [Actinomycetota bacterium]
MIYGSKKAVRRAKGAMAMLALVVGACTNGSQSQMTADGQPVERLTIAVPEDVGPLNIFASHEEPLTELVYDKLLGPSPYVDDPQPWLASEVRQLDPATWEVDLRDGVTWHDGETFTAADVVFTFEFFKAAPTGRWTHHVSDIPTIETVEAVDDNTVRFTCADACPFLGSVTLADLPIVAEHVWSDVPADQVREVTDLPVGTGPYRLVEYDSVSGYRFEAYENYFAGPPLVQELVMPVIEDPSATFTALRTGEIQATSRPLAPELIAEFASSDDIELITTRPLQFPELRMNFERPPFDVPEFRRAISRALDRAELLDAVFLGEGRRADKGYPHPDAAWTNPDLSTPFDAAEASSLLDELGYEDTDGDSVREGPAGPLRFTIQVAATEPTDVRAAELIRADLAEIGISADVQTKDAASIGELFRSRDFDLYINTITAHGVADPTQFIMSHRSGYLWKAPDMPYPQWDALFEQWSAATTIADRTKTLFEMQELFNSQPTSVPLYYPDEYHAYRAGTFDGWVESPGSGVVHKWSLLPPEVGRDANAVVTGE